MGSGDIRMQIQRKKQQQIEKHQQFQEQQQLGRQFEQQQQQQQQLGQQAMHQMEQLQQPQQQLPQQQPSQHPQNRRQSQRNSSRARTRRNTISGYLFISPMLLGMIVFTLFPIVASFVLSFTDWRFVTGFDKIKFIGIDNFKNLMTDTGFRESLVNNLILLLVVPITMALALLIAVIINKHVYFKNAFKVIYFMPGISSVVAIAVVFQIIFHPSHGPANSLLKALGVENPPLWLADPTYALPSVMLITIWIELGYNMLIYIAGLQDIPKDLYEAADIDGATGWDKFRNITLPMLSRTTFFLLITGVIGTFKVFSLIKVLTDGGPAHATSTIVYDLYTTAFINLKTGYASAMAIVLFACVLLITAIQWYGQRKWVNY